MRLILLLALGLLILGAVFWLLKQFWKTAHTPEEGTATGEAANDIEQPPPWIESRQARLLLILVMVLFGLMGLEHVLRTNKQAPPETYIPPHMEEGKLVPGQFK
ncbi:MAG: hypothetical protein HQL52_02175 [Magnetococcales bacterium]|nr:hypothetical protein [Magnetococcales bacterium]